MKIILTSKAAGGKDFFRNYIKQYQPVDVSYTTRPIREGEIEDYTYHFISEEKFSEMEAKDELFENVAFNGWKYGTSRNSWDNNKVFILTPSGISQIPKSDRKNCIVVFFDVHISDRRDRLNKRSDADKTVRRLVADDIDFANFSDFDIRIRNPLFNPAVVFQLIKDYKYADRS